jgi:hypothetical protein
MRALVIVIAAVAPAFAQGNLEVHPFVGFRWAGTLRLAEKDPMPVMLDNSPVMGAAFAFRTSATLSVEAQWVSQWTTGSSALGKIRIGEHQFLGNFLLDTSPATGRLQPYLLFGAGSNIVTGTDEGGAKVAWGAGGGARYFFSRRFGIRFQMRYAATTLFSTPGADNTKKDHDMSQGEFTLGWIWRFHEPRPRRQWPTDVLRRSETPLHIEEFQSCSAGRSPAPIQSERRF